MIKLLPLLLTISATALFAADTKPAASSERAVSTAADPAPRSPLRVGTPAPAITAIDHEAKPVNFSDVYAKGPTLVYFYPKADTPGCTKQGCSLRDSWADLQAKGIQVLGVSGDKPEAQKAFREKHNFQFPLIADDDGKVAAAFGVPPMRPGIYKRTSFLVKGGKIAWSMTEKTTTDTHAADVLKAVAELK